MYIHVYICMYMYMHMPTYMYCMQGNRLSDWWLSVGVVAMTMPVVIVLIVWSCFDMRLETMRRQEEVSGMAPLKFIKCSSTYSVYMTDSSLLY